MSAPTPAAPDALRILPYGRFGNNIRQIANATHVAKVLGARTIYVGEVNIGLLTAPLTFEDIALIPSAPPRHERIMSDTFFDRSAFAKLFSGFEGERQLAIMSAVIAPILGNRWRAGPRATDDTLHIHIRSGDIFSMTVHPDYVPPPLAYYTHAIRDFQKTCAQPKIVLMFEDERNPCIRPLREMLRANGVEFCERGDDFEATVGELLCARNLVASVGTLVPMIALASTNIRRLYAFRDVPSFRTFVAKRTVVVRVRDVGDAYIARKNWTNSADQFRQINDYPEAALAGSEEAAILETEAEDAKGHDWVRGRGFGGATPRAISRLPRRISNRLGRARANLVGSMKPPRSPDMGWRASRPRKGSCWRRPSRPERAATSTKRLGWRRICV